VYNFDDATLFVYDDYGLNQNRYSNKPYLLISKKDGNVVDSLNIHLPVRVPNRVFHEVIVDGQTYTQPITLSMSNNRSYGKNFLITDWSSDTIYRLSPQKELQPVIVRKPSVQKTEPKMVVTNNLITDKFIFFTKTVLDFEFVKKTMQFPPIMNMMYDFETGQINEYKLINKDFESSNIDFVSTITTENTGVYKLDFAELFEEGKAGKIKGELKQFLKSLNEEDNPILVKITF
jgi:hypothetical protein